MIKELYQRAEFYLPEWLETCVQGKFYLGKAARIGERFSDRKARINITGGRR